MGRAERLAKRDEQGRHVTEAKLAVDTLGQLRDGTEARLLPSLGERLREDDPPFPAQLASEAIHQLVGGEAVVPDVEMALRGKAAHPLAVLAHAGEHEPLSP